MVQIGFKSNRGIVRANNEDACFVIPGSDVYIVADGVGGNNSGEVASRTAVEKIAAFVNSTDIRRCNDPGGDLRIHGRCHRTQPTARYIEMGQRQTRYRGMATTVVMAYLYRGEGYIGNVGDSRAYLFRQGKLSRVTKDHTYVNELIDKGVITEDEAESHKQKNVITKALGAEPQVEPGFLQAAAAQRRCASCSAPTVCTERSAKRRCWRSWRRKKHERHMRGSCGLAHPVRRTGQHHRSLCQDIGLGRRK